MSWIEWPLRGVPRRALVVARRALLSVVDALELEMDSRGAEELLKKPFVGVSAEEARRVFFPEDAECVVCGTEQEVGQMWTEVTEGHLCGSPVCAAEIARRRL